VPRLAYLLALLVLAIAAAPPSALGQSTSWTTGLPADGCPAPVPEGDCVDQVASALSDHVEQVGCEHHAIFALTYQRITERIANAVRDSGYFVEPRYIAHFDVEFAAEYGRQWDAWTGAPPGVVAPAWRIALDAAEARRVSGNGNLLLAINAHIGRDMPFVLERVGLVSDIDGSSHKPDQDRVDPILEAAMGPVLDELARKYDPTVNDGDLPGGDDDRLVYRFVAALRERAWRLAEQLAAAGSDPVARAIVATRIEEEARANALAIATLTAYPPGSGGSRARDEDSEGGGGPG
jgi:hypothetical protein